MIKKPFLALMAAFVLAAFALVPPASAADGSLLTIRLVKAGQGNEVDPTLKDVAALMKGNLAFSSFKLLETQTVPLPASGSVRLGAYKVSLTGPGNNLDIAISRGTVTTIKTHAVLHGRSPLVLGGIPARDGTLLFVLTLN